ncbi:MAG: tail fiber domain-containing protein [Pedobacter sp.]
MKHLFKAKGLVTGLLLTICAVSASAQKIDEQQLKTGITEISNPLEYLETLKPITFKYDRSKFKEGKWPMATQHGFLAQDFKIQHPELVFEAFKTFPAGKGSTKTIRYDEVSSESLIPVLVAAIKEQQAQIEALKQQLSQMKAK